MKIGLTKLREIAQGSRHQNQPSLLEFSPIDVEKIAVDLELEKLGAENGGEGRPLSGAKSLDPVEVTITDKIQNLQTHAIEQLTGQLDICSDRLRQLQFDALITSVKSETRATVTDFEQNARDGENVLFQSRRELVEATEALESFKKQHGIYRPAHDKPNGLVTAFLLISVFAVESAANAGLMGEAHETGYIGAYSLAVALSFINVLAGFAAGYIGLRAAYHQGTGYRVWGGLVVGAYLAFIFLFNLYIAHVRDAMQSGGLNEALREVWPKLWSFEFNFTDYQAPVMLLIGIAFSLVAFYKGFKHDDPYPDYGRQSRLRTDCENAYTDISDGLGKDLAQMRDDVKEVLNNVATELGFRRNDYFGIMSTIRKLLQRFKAHEQHLESSCNRLLEVYRDANRKVRKKGEPRHFKKPYVLDLAHVEEPAVEKIYPEAKVEELINEGKALIDNAIVEIDEAHKAAFHRYAMISQVFDSAELKATAQLNIEKSDGLKSA
jgi:hypothetical protein